MKIALIPFVLVVAHAQTLQVTSALGTKFYSQLDEKGMVAAAQKAVDGDPRNPALLLKLAQAQAAVWQERESVATCTRGLEIAPDNADLYTERGHRELPLRQFEKARDALRKAAELDPKKMAAHYHLGLAYYFLREYSQSADAFKHAVETAPNLDERINATNWLYAALRRAGKPQEAAAALAKITPEMKNTEPHTYFYLTLVRFFQNAMQESEVVPPVPSGSDTEAELAFDTVAYGVGNWQLYNNHAAKAQEYFRRVVKGHVWVTWGFIASELELVRSNRARLD